MPLVVGSHGADDRQHSFTSHIYLYHPYLPCLKAFKFFLANLEADDIGIVQANDRALWVNKTEVTPKVGFCDEVTEKGERRRLVRRVGS